MNWYLIQTKPNAHQLASNNLNQQGFEVFLPLVRKTHRRSNKFITQPVPLFPGYLFIGTRADSVNYKSVNSTRGVSKFVTLDGRYRPISAEIIKGIKSECDPMGIVKKESFIKVGDQATIEKGPFSGFLCEIVKLDANSRVWILIEMMQQKTLGQVSLNNVTKIL